MEEAEMVKEKEKEDENEVENERKEIVVVAQGEVGRRKRIEKKMKRGTCRWW